MRGLHKCVRLCEHELTLPTTLAAVSFTDSMPVCQKVERLTLDDGIALASSLEASSEGPAGVIAAGAAGTGSAS